MDKEDMKEEIEEMLEEVEDTDEFLTVRNPKNRRIVHIIGQERVENSLGSSVRGGLCGMYQISGTSMSRLLSNFDECVEIKTRNELEQDQSTCKNCLQKL